MSSSRSPRPWPRRCTTPHEDRRRPVPGEEDSELNYTAAVWKTPPPQPVLFSLYDEEPGGRRPASLAEPPGPQEQVQRHTKEHIVDFVCFAPMVQIVDAPVPLTLEQLPDVLHFFDTLTPDPEQVIEVPKILLDDVPMRTVVRDPQLAEQLVDVPTNLGYALAVIAFLCLRVGGGEGERGEVLKVLSQYRIQQWLRSRSLIFQLVEVFKVFAQVRVPLLPHRVDCFTTQMKEFKGFPHFSLAPKKCGGAPPVECERALIKWLLLGSLMSQGRMRLVTPCPLLMRPYGGSGEGERAEAEAAGGATVQKSVGIPVMDVVMLFSDTFQQSTSSS